VSSESPHSRTAARSRRRSGVRIAVAAATAGAVAARVLRAVERFAPEPASDDMAILALRVPTP